MAGRVPDYMRNAAFEDTGGDQTDTRKMSRTTGWTSRVRAGGVGEGAGTP